MYEMYNDDLKNQIEHDILEIQLSKVCASPYFYNLNTMLNIKDLNANILAEKANNDINNKEYIFNQILTNDNSLVINYNTYNKLYRDKKIKGEIDYVISKLHNYSNYIIADKVRIINLIKRQFIKEVKYNINMFIVDHHFLFRGNPYNIDFFACKNTNAKLIIPNKETYDRIYNITNFNKAIEYRNCYYDMFDDIVNDVVYSNFNSFNSNINYIYEKRNDINKYMKQVNDERK